VEIFPQIKSKIFIFIFNLIYDNQGFFFPGKRGAGTHKRGKDKYTESFVTISLSCLPTS
jgi:hypothetical protein